MVQLYLDAHSALEQATSTFTVLDECTYATKNLGLSGQIEVMACDCSRNHTGDGPLCDEDSHCVNRLTSIECVGDQCGHSDCANRRFQERRYAKIDVFDAGAKGFGVRALENIAQGDLIYEYIGEVIDENRFQKRQRLYEQQDVKHFYFMMLQKDEFIDATQKGSIARFCNHSCKPNSFVDKWIVGLKLRMGIFAKRDIQAGEEITFDYNVDRYGAEPQKCLCMEDNCVGILGGKTQSTGLRIPQSVYDALGLGPDDEEEWLKAVTKQKKKELSAETSELLPTKMIEDPEEVSKIMSVLMQSRDRWLVDKLISRIAYADSSTIQIEVLRMHGYEIFSTLLSQWQEESESVMSMLEILLKWPRLTRNKISSSKIEGVVADLAKNSSVSADVTRLAGELLEKWSALEMAYRIPRQKRDKTESDDTTPSEGSEQIEKPVAKDTVAKTPINEVPRIKLPPGWFAAYAKDGTIYYHNQDRTITTWERPKDPRDVEREKQRAREREANSARLEVERAKQAQDLQKIIDDAAQQQVSGETSPEKEKSSKPEQDTKRSSEWVITKVLARYIPKVVWKYEDKLGHDRCKKHSREIVEALVDKELKKGRESVELTEEKKKKIKGFVSTYMQKALLHHEEKEARKRHHPHNGENSKRPKITG